MKKTVVGLGALLSLGLATAAGCAHPNSFVWVEDYANQVPPPAEFRFAVDDELAVAVWNQPQLSGAHRVRNDGMITLPLVGDVAVAGLTTEGAAAQIAAGLEGLVVEPKVTVELLARAAPQVTVAGEVRNPGRLALRPQDGVLELLAQAGGLTEFADRDGIYVLRRDSGVTRVRFRHQQLLGGDPGALAFQLRDGDVIVVE